jgi:hypothetical protein
MNKADRFSSPDQDPLKARFLQGTLQEEGEYITDFQEEVMGRHLITRTGNLRIHRGFKVTKSGEGFKLDIRFLKYLRFLDMKGKEGVPKEQLILYNRVIYGRLSNIASTIQYGFTDSMRELMAKAYKDLKIEI